MKVVLDTNVIVAAMRSPSGASAALLRAARRGELSMVANVALALEYEATCSRAEHVLASGLTQAQVDIFLDAVVALAEPVETHFLWRPVLRDPGDEMVLEAAANGRAAAIVTFNLRDFGAVSQQFGIEVLSPIATLRRITP
jgi:putative PIN family toxin of toxin-antitoxin system